MGESELSREERYLDEAVISKIKQILADAGVGNELRHLKISEKSATKLITLLINSIMIENATLKRALMVMQENMGRMAQADIYEYISLPKK
jgi:hypothetical protein